MARAGFRHPAGRLVLAWGDAKQRHDLKSTDSRGNAPRAPATSTCWSRSSSRLWPLPAHRQPHTAIPAAPALPAPRVPSSPASIWHPARQSSARRAAATTGMVRRTRRMRVLCAPRCEGPACVVEGHRPSRCRLHAFRTLPSLGCHLQRGTPTLPLGADPAPKPSPSRAALFRRIWRLRRPGAMRAVDKRLLHRNCGPRARRSLSPPSYSSHPSHPSHLDTLHTFKPFTLDFAIRSRKAPCSLLHTFHKVAYAPRSGSEQVSAHSSRPGTRIGWSGLHCLASMWLDFSRFTASFNLDGRAGLLRNRRRFL